MVADVEFVDRWYLGPKSSYRVAEGAGEPCALFRSISI